mmetsp:Transcript_16756/g.34538  ORF Transcript_16756/g.34538 Transcript_16756/m.34538 type:complete len:109 (-) Transcript_16756:72-398(-)|eukprot:CAMPEP_0184679890 /NCGR_PEP_ID=MMETSP0312-20130426/2769_1 /TAXON_ID=31354 /ORGANISM="Compsopogon coeruleus, Strain SAG 36.94" /LENGTH=108 /DNA_ID=CAMNT_0027129647 /DNA_START=356 /DNA_END=682 /DNA_ORIENTATION=-
MASPAVVDSGASREFMYSSNALDSKRAGYRKPYFASPRDNARSRVAVARGEGEIPSTYNCHVTLKTTLRLSVFQVHVSSSRIAPLQPFETITNGLDEPAVNVDCMRLK